MEHPSHPNMANRPHEKKKKNAFAPDLCESWHHFALAALYLHKVESRYFTHSLQTVTEVQTESGLSHSLPNSMISEQKALTKKLTWWSFAALQQLHLSLRVIWISNYFYIWICADTLCSLCRTQVAICQSVFIIMHSDLQATKWQVTIDFLRRLHNMQPWYQWRWQTTEL